MVLMSEATFGSTTSLREQIAILSFIFSDADFTFIFKNIANVLFFFFCTCATLKASLLVFFLCKQKFPELKFKYVEEDQPEDFFIPYVWSLVFNSGVGLHWSPHGIELFSMDSG